MRSPELFASLSNDALLVEIERLAAREREATAELIAALAELDARRLYLAQGFSSLFTYCTSVLHLSEHAAYGRITAARASREYPIVLRMLAAGAITLTAICLLAPHLTPENHVEVLEAARYKRRREVEVQAAALRARFGQGDRESPHHEVIRAVEPDAYRIELTISGATFSKFCRARDLLRHRVPHGEPAMAADRALDALLEDLQNRKCATVKRPRDGNSTAGSTRHIPARVRRAVWKRDAGRCAFVGARGRCEETAFLEFHHVEPFATGGKPTVENIELRCRAHNVHEADLFFGPATTGESEPTH